MAISAHEKEELLSVTTDSERLSNILTKAVKTKKELQDNEKPYYDREKDKQAVEQYYKSINLEQININELGKLLKETHSRPLRYDPSEYVYPWVDLRPDGKLKSIYSGENREVEDVIKEDYETSIKREEAIEMAEAVEQDQVKVLEQIASKFKYNCEHVVPQSWFDKQEPMRGDLHHLFTCEPVCNSIRSNYPYHDFKDYEPEKMKVSRIEDKCGKAEEELFEPEFAKGTAARAMLYFLVRYPEKIEKEHKDKIDIELLFKWHNGDPPAEYELHRNQAIYEIQGNRNPFIDFPDKITALK
ncbi:endonuclease I family protein [Halobacillus sp. Marseille-Q1614]|uniref:endonuclease I family protein n=1 Tax=Halobacillus sp. Marseille-Q1614 TaxID=2709134 RepID=UPI00156E80ED|nr:endonuclease [Halobacillus sp. Marseille-Q1614]